MRVFFLAILSIAWICGRSCYAADLIHTSVGVIDPSPYVRKDTNPEVHSRKKRSFSSSEEQAILDKHNELRSGVSPEASDMNFMVWDEDLATLATEWSEMCIWDHGTPESDTTSMFDPYGQNLWLGTNEPDGVGSTQSWYNEVNYYDYETRNCSGVCGHYTQVVWADSYALGCGKAFCTSTEQGHEDVWIFTCHYGPAGNYNRHPYLTGDSCTQCSSGYGTCYNNQCRDCDVSDDCDCRQVCQNCGTLTSSCSCTCRDGFTENDCSAVCEDTHENCRNGWYPAQCNYDFVRDGCPLMCGLCVEDTADDFECVTTEAPVQMETTISQEHTTANVAATTEAPVQMATPTEQEHTTERECALDCLNEGECVIKDDGDEVCECVHGFTGQLCHRITMYCPCIDEPVR